MTISYKQEPFEKHPYDELWFGFIFDADLPEGVLVDDVEGAAITCIDGDDDPDTTLDVSSLEPTEDTIEYQGQTIAAGRAVRGFVTGGTHGCTYQVTIKVNNDDTPQTKCGRQFKVVMDPEEQAA